MTFLHNVAVVAAVGATLLFCTSSMLAKPLPPREGCRAASKVEYESAKREFLLSIGMVCMSRRETCGNTTIGIVPRSLGGKQWGNGSSRPSLRLSSIEATNYTQMSCDNDSRIDAKATETSHGLGDYLRDEARKYRKLAEEADDPLIKKELLELAEVCEEAADNIEDRMTAG